VSWDEVRQIADLGFEVGSHTVTHADLAALSAAEARRELVESRSDLARRLGRPVRWFAFPFGGRNNITPESLALVEQAGYEGTVSAYGGLVGRGGPARLLPRVPVPAFRSLAHLELYLAGCLEWLYGAKDRLGLSHRVETVQTAGYAAQAAAGPGGAAPQEVGSGDA
jgi:peptidoglycan/xylan/chitin deacetylase (PgdA/CDA1 family)